MIIELIGLAGSGKSSLADMLTNHHSNIRKGFPPSYYDAENIPFFVRNAVTVLPGFISSFFDKKIKFSRWHHLIYNVLINGWPQILRQEALDHASALLLDQGPIYMMTFEIMFGFGMNRSNSAVKFWKRAYHHWAETLDIVVWLDASTELLIERVRARKKWHGIKKSDDIDAFTYMDTCRQTYSSVVSQLITHSPGLKLIKVDTGNNNLDECVHFVLQRIYQ